MSKRLAIYAEPQPVTEGTCSLGDLLFTAWRRGNEGRRWDEAQPLVETIEALFKSEVSKALAAERERYAESRIFSPDSLPQTPNAVVDLWVERHQGHPERLPSCRLTVTGYVDNTPSTMAWYAPDNGSVREVTGRIVGWSLVPEFPKGQTASG